MMETIKVELAPKELEQLIETAGEHLRTFTDQASYYVKQGLKQDNLTRSLIDPYAVHSYTRMEKLAEVLVTSIAQYLKGK
jgi:hypothetical protein